MIRCQVKRASEFISEREPFRASNLFACNSDRGRLYVVFSYGKHWPIAFYDGDEWSINTGPPPSATTRRHTRLVHAAIYRQHGASVRLCAHEAMLQTVRAAFMT